MKNKTHIQIIIPIIIYILLHDDESSSSQIPSVLHLLVFSDNPNKQFCLLILPLSVLSHSPSSEQYLVSSLQLLVSISPHIPPSKHSRLFSPPLSHDTFAISPTFVTCQTSSAGQKDILSELFVITLQDVELIFSHVPFSLQKRV